MCPIVQLRHAEVFADFEREELVDLAMARNRGDLALGPVHVHSVRAAFPEEFAAVTLEMTDEFRALHAVSLKRSRMTEALASACSLRARLASRTSVTAS